MPGRSTLAGCVLASFVTFASGGAAAQDIFRGKTITLIVGYSPGGGVDLPARMFARYMAQNLAGAPTIVIRNMPGAAGAIAMNFLTERADKDGLTIAYDSWQPVAQITETLGARFDYTKLTPIGAVRAAPFVVFARRDILPGGLGRPADLVKVKGLIYGGMQPAQVLDLHGRLGLDVLKVDYKYVRGYPGAVDIRTAIERGEAHVTAHGLQGYRSGVEPNLVKPGIVLPLWNFPHRDAGGSFIASAKIPDMQPFAEVYRRARGGSPAGLEWEALLALSTFYGTATNFLWGPPGMDPRALAPLAKAFAAAVVDPVSAAEQEKAFGFAYDLIALDAAAQAVASLDKVDPRLVAFFKAYVK